MSPVVSVQDAMNFSREKMKENHKQYLNPGVIQMLGLMRFDKQYVRSKGIHVWDSDGNQYLDFLGGYGALSLGHNPPEVIEALIEVMRADTPNLMQASAGTMAAALGEALAEITPGDLRHSFLCNSGAEAVEGALKTGRIASGRTTVLSTESAFHGKSFGALSASGREKYKKPFQPLLSNFEQIPYGDSDALEKRLRRNDVGVFILEPIQGEGGVIVPPAGYLKRVRELCTRHNTILIMDEIQTGLARTGRMFACMWEGVTPDIMTLSKSLGGSVMPIGAFICTPQVWDKAYGSPDKCLLHTSTFGGNAFASAVSLAAINLIVKQNLCAQAEEKGAYFMGRLKQLQARHELIKEVRGRGLMIGLEFKQPTGLMSKLVGGLSNEYLGAMVAGVLQNDHRIITAYTLNNPNVIRLQPPLIVEREQLDQLVDALEDVFSRNKSIMDFTMKSAKNILAKN